jgi:integrase/recombinase XerD
VAYKTALGYFRESCTKLHVEDVDRRDLLKYPAFLRDEKGLSPRSVSNKFDSVTGFLKGQGVRGIVSKNDRPRFTQEEPEIYEKEELDALFAVCDEEERLWFEFFLCTGLREQEVMYTYWTDINLTHATLRVTHKPVHGWSQKRTRSGRFQSPQTSSSITCEKSES